MRLKLIVDLAEESGKGWIGSIIIPGFGVKGAPLADLHVEEFRPGFHHQRSSGQRTRRPGEIRAHLTPDGHLSGEFKQGGNTAPFVLEKTGPPQVELPPRSTPVSKELEGEWKGEYEMNGYARQVTMKFADRGAEAPVWNS